MTNYHLHKYPNPLESLRVLGSVRLNLVYNYEMLMSKIATGAILMLLVSPVQTFPDLTLFAPAKTSRYTVINRGTVPTKTDRVLSHGVTPVKPRSWSRFNHDVTAQAGVPRFYYGGVPVTAGHVTVMPRCLPVLKMIVTMVNRDGTG